MRASPFLRADTPERLQVVTGTVTRAPASVDGDLFINLALFDDLSEWGPCPWAPRATAAGGGVEVILPAVGASVLAVLTEDETPWVVDYDDTGGVVAGSGSGGGGGGGTVSWATLAKFGVE